MWVIFIPDSHKGQTLIMVAKKDSRTTRQSVDVGHQNAFSTALSLPGPGVGFGAEVGLDDFEYFVGVAALMYGVHWTYERRQEVAVAEGADGHADDSIDDRNPEGAAQ